MTRVLGVAVPDGATTVTDHDAACCAAGRQWLAGLHLARSARDLLDCSWVSRRFGWGPVSSPVAWCDLPGMDTADCGLQAAVAHACLESCGYPVRRVQFVLRYSAAELDHWRALWLGGGVDADWIGRERCYHEAVAVGTGAIRVLDASDAVEWTNPVTEGVLALRVVGDRLEPSLTWGGRSLEPGRWESFGG